MKDISICILNYNGESDTKKCVDSILKYEHFTKMTIILLDNGSQGKSVRDLEEYLDKLNFLNEINTLVCNLSNLDNISFQNYDIVLIKSRENYGFANGNNILIKKSIDNNFKHITLLNNDIVITSSSITKLSQFLDNNTDFGVLTSNILYYSDPAEVWNAGGKLLLGTRKYNKNKFVKKKLKERKDVVAVDFITGCFIMVREEIFVKYGVLTNKFFFGEEDYEFSMRMKINNVKMGVLLNTSILHKVGATINNNNKNRDSFSLNKTLIHHLNRYINMKDFYPRIKWQMWKKISNIYIFVLLTFKKKESFTRTIKYLQILNRLSIKYNEVDKYLFNQIISCENFEGLLTLE